SAPSSARARRETSPRSRRSGPCSKNRSRDPGGVGSAQRAYAPRAFSALDVSHRSCYSPWRHHLNRGYRSKRGAVMPNSIRLHRVLRATPERVYRAFLDPDALAKWLPPNGFTGKVHHLEAKVGGTYKMSFTNFSSKKSHSFGGTYVELVPNERIR